MTQLKIKPSLPCFAGERSNHKAMKQHIIMLFTRNNTLLSLKQETGCKMPASWPSSYSVRLRSVVDWV